MGIEVARILGHAVIEARRARRAREAVNAGGEKGEETQMMSAGIARRLKPEEELSRKREELAAVRATLAERELELVEGSTALPGV
jgi:hypothetical protein